MTTLLTHTAIAGEKTNKDVVFTSDELNVMRYACGYVAHSLLKKYEKRAGEKFSQFVVCLGEMAVVGEGEDLLAYTRTWINLVNRGGLFPLNDGSFSFFVEIEKIVRLVLPKHVLATSTDENYFKRNVHDNIIQNDDVQFHWCLLSQDIDDPDDSQELLTEIVKLWVTVRGFSITASWMEAYKKKEKKTTQKCTGLRKSVSGSS